MANVKFEYEGQVSGGLNSWDTDSRKRITVELNDNDLTVYEMLEEFMNFMQAIGYKFELGDRLDVVNDFTKEQTPPTVDDYKIDFSKYDTIVDEGGTVVGRTQYAPSEEELGAEIERIRNGKPGLSEEAYEMAAYTNLANKRV